MHNFQVGQASLSRVLAYMQEPVDPNMDASRVLKQARESSRLEITLVKKRDCKLGARVDPGGSISQIHTAGLAARSGLQVWAERCSTRTRPST